ncbi:Uncharacterised protein [Serratia proteamaculans]|uniref:hypothetical protein n=1 Tax=Serratia proteamaculans TaxID=28151 RepID=UPI002184371A|nr:hypothetical protein [Serratia proteamaculans]CAI2427846.1 Uncharacterised protein [Serratia proteamaculans]
MKKLIFITIISIFSTSCLATVNPKNLANCAPGVHGVVTGLYSDIYNKKAAIKINGNFYYLSWYTDTSNVLAAYETAVSAYFSGAETTIMECQDKHITSIQVGS